MNDLLTILDEVLSSENGNDWLEPSTWAAIFSALAAIASFVVALIVALSQNKKEKNQLRISSYLSLIGTLADMRVCVDWISNGEVPEFNLFKMDKRLSMDFRRVDAYGFFYRKKKVTDQMSPKRGSLSGRICDLSEDFKTIYNSAEAALKAGENSAEYKLLQLRCDNFFKAESALNKEFAMLLEKN